MSPGDTEEVDLEGWPALNFALLGGNKEIIQLLLQHNPDIKNENELIALARNPRNGAEREEVHKMLQDHISNRIIMKILQSNGFNFFR